MRMDLGEWILVISAMDWEHSIISLWWTLFFQIFYYLKLLAKKRLGKLPVK